MEQKNQRRKHASDAAIPPAHHMEMSVGRSMLHTEQLAFVYEAAGEARPVHSEGTQASTPPVGPELGAGRSMLQRGILADALMEAVVDAENMRQAHKRVRANKGSPGIDGMTVKEMTGYLKKEWPRIRLELLAGRYQPQPVKRVEIPKPDGGVRHLGIPTVVDRLIQPVRASPHSSL